VNGQGTPEVTGELREILARATGREELLGLSEQAPLLLREVHRRFGVDVAAEDLNLDSLATLGTLAAYITEHVPAGPVSGG